MGIREEIEKGYEGGFTFEDLMTSDLTPKERAEAEVVRIEGIRRRWLAKNAAAPAMVKRSRGAGDIAFLGAVIERLRRVIGAALQDRDRANFRATSLEARVKRLEAERAEKKIIAPNGREMRAVLASRRDRE